jgi:hypothetical protein
MPGATRAGQDARSGSGFKLVLSLDSDHHPLPETTYRGDPVALCVLQPEKVTTYPTICIHLL